MISANARKPRVAYWNLGPSPYIVGRLNEVARRRNLDLEVWFNVRQIPGRQWELKRSEWLFPASVLEECDLLGSKLENALKELRRFAPDVVVCGYDSRSRTLGSVAAKAAGARVVFRVLPSFRTWVKPSPTHELAKHFLFRMAEGAKVSGRLGQATAERYGMPADRIVTVRQSIDRDHYATANRLRCGVGRDLRARLGLCGVVFIYVGRLWIKKGLDYLFEAYRRLVAFGRDISLLVVGHGPDEAAYRKSMADVRRCVFAGFVRSADLPMYYGAADVMVFPTLGDPFGLVVEEAMAAGLPVISSSSAGEIRDRIIDGQTGYIVAPADTEAIAQRMLALADDAGSRARMGICAGKAGTIADHGTYARDFEAMVDIMLTKARRSNSSAVVARMVGNMLSRVERGRRADRTRSLNPPARQRKESGR